MKDAATLLNEALSARSANNASYSLRAFARDLGLSPQQLSNVMNGRRGLSPELAEKILAKLDLDPYEASVFRESLKSRFARGKLQRSAACEKLRSLQAQSEVKNLEVDLFRAIASWHHFALLELLKITAGQARRTEWYARRLGISGNEASLAFGRLERLELIQKTAQGWAVNHEVVIADRGMPSEAVRAYHRQILDKATQALVFQTSEERYGSSSTIPIRVKDLERAKKMIQDFRLSFDQELSDDGSGEEIYGLSIQFFRLTHNQRTKA